MAAPIPAPAPRSEPGRSVARSDGAAESARPDRPVPAPAAQDDKDWTWVLAAPCPECGFDAATVTGADVPAIVDEVVASFVGALAAPDADQRREPTVWSVVEYGCHIRDVCDIFSVRARSMLDKNDPEFENWDQDRTAVDQMYWTQAPAAVAAQLPGAGARVSAVFSGVRADQWARVGRRSNGSVFTVDSLGRYLAHDLLHHQHDITGPPTTP